MSSTLDSDMVCLIPTGDDVQEQTFHFRYSCSQNLYERLSSTSTRRNTGWQSLAHGQPQLRRVEDMKSMCAYLTRHPDQDVSTIAWKIELEGTGVHGKTLELRAASRVTDSGTITWKIIGNNGHTHTVDGLDVQTAYTVDIQGYSSVVIVAEVTGSGRHDAQLFRQPVIETETSYPFEVKLRMETAQTKVYRLTTLERKLQLFQLRYFCDGDVYDRRSSGYYMQGLKSGLYHSEGLVRETEQGHVFWTLNEDAKRAVLTWRIDLSDTDMCVEKMALMAKCKVNGTGAVIWTISADDKSVNHPGLLCSVCLTLSLLKATGDALNSREIVKDALGEHLYTARFINMKRCTVVTLEATLTAGSGGAPCKQAQIFPQMLGATERVFDCKLFLVKAAEEEE